MVRKYHHGLDQLFNEDPTLCGRSGLPDSFYVDLRQQLRHLGKANRQLIPTSPLGLDL